MRSRGQGKATMTIVQTIIIAVACFSAIPMPFVAWNEQNMRHMLAALPLVGVVIGACQTLWSMLGARIGMGPFLSGVGLALIPLIATGGIHLDGFADVADAQSSHATPERKREIMKDPHIGAFAVMGICGYLLAYAALASELSARQVCLLGCVAVVSRCLCSFASLTWPLSSASDMLATVRSMARVRNTCLALAIELVLVIIAMAALSPLAAAVSLALSGAYFWWCRRFAQREYGGISGDVSGFLLQGTELAMLVGIAIAGGAGWI